MALITMRDVTIAFEGVAAIEHVNLSIERGDYLVIVGENGSGKSTLMRAILGLVRPHSGQVLYGDGLRRSQIGYLPQQTAAQRDFPASVSEIVLSGCLGKSGFHPFYTKAQKKLAAENMEKMNTTPLAGRCYRELSGGQQQRVLLARALCATTKLLLLDEPVAGLDPKATREMYEIIASLNRTGITVIMVSHDIASAVKYASHILHLGNTPKFFGSKEDYLKTDVGRAFTSEEASGNE